MTKMTTKNKQTSKQNKKQQQQQQNGRRGWGLKKQLTEWSSDVVIIIVYIWFTGLKKIVGWMAFIYFR